MDIYHLRLIYISVVLSLSCSIILCTTLKVNFLSLLSFEDLYIFTKQSPQSGSSEKLFFQAFTAEGSETSFSMNRLWDYNCSIFFLNRSYFGIQTVGCVFQIFSLTDPSTIIPLYPQQFNDSWQDFFLVYLVILELLEIDVFKLLKRDRGLILGCRP